MFAANTLLERVDLETNYLSDLPRGLLSSNPAISSALFFNNNFPSVPRGVFSPHSGAAITNIPQLICHN